MDDEFVKTAQEGLCYRGDEFVRPAKASECKTFERIGPEARHVRELRAFSAITGFALAFLFRLCYILSGPKCG